MIKSSTTDCSRLSGCGLNKDFYETKRVHLPNLGKMKPFLTTDFLVGNNSLQEQYTKKQTQEANKVKKLLVKVGTSAQIISAS